MRETRLKTYFNKFGFVYAKPASHSFVPSYSHENAFEMLINICNLCAGTAGACVYRKINRKFVG